MDKIEVSPRARRNAQALLKKIDCMGGESDDAEVILAFARFERDILATRTDATPVATDVAALVEARVLESRHIGRWQITLDFDQNKDAARHFADAYRTGQLVAVQPDDATVERVEIERLREALRQCRRAISHGNEEPRHNVREIVDEALSKGPKP